MNQREERQGVAVQDGRLRAVQGHSEIVHPCPGHGGHQMLNHADPHAVLFQYGAQPGFAHQIIARRNPRAILVGTNKHHALPRRRRRQDHGYGDTRMQGDAGGGDGSGERVAAGHAGNLPRRAFPGPARQC